MSKCCCLILNYNDSKTTIELVNTINYYKNIDEILVVDNCSTDNSLDYLQSIRTNHVHIISCLHNGGYGAGNNYGIEYARKSLGCKYVIIANPDVKFTDSLIESMLGIISKIEKCAAISAVQYDKNNNQILNIAWKIPSAFKYAFTFSRIGTMFAKTLYDNNYFTERVVEVDCVPGAMLMVDSDKFEQIQGYDEKMFLYCEEDTLGFKIKQNGYVTLLLTDEHYIHEHGVSINKSISSTIQQLKMVYKNKLYFMREYLHANAIEMMIAHLNIILKIALLKIKGE